MFNYHCKDDCNNFPYRGCRRALSRIGDCIFGIMTDTNSSIGNLVPKESDDKSVRFTNNFSICSLLFLHLFTVLFYRQEKLETLLGPFIHIASTDIYRFEFLLT